jgi:hypothetical protein
MKSNRKRNVARKAKSNRTRTGSVSAPLNSDPQSGFVSQNAHATTSDLRNAPPETGNQEPEAGNGFVSQNRANAQHITGPRTAEGKAASAQNAFKHGLSIQRHALLRDEDPAAYAQLLAELREIYEPRSPREALAVEDVAQCRWALQRFDEAEAVSLQKLTDSFNDPVDFEGAEIIGAGESLALAATILTDVDEKDRSFVEPDETYPTFEKIHRYRTHWERKQARALAEFDRAQRARHAEAQAQRQTEAHALKQELALGREARQQEIHFLRAPAKVQQSPAATESQNSTEDAALAHLETLLNAPTPITEQDFLRVRAAQPANGFVSQNGLSTCIQDQPSGAGSQKPA